MGFPVVVGLIVLCFEELNGTSLWSFILATSTQKWSLYLSVRREYLILWPYRPVSGDPTGLVMYENALTIGQGVHYRLGGPAVVLEATGRSDSPGVYFHS